MELVPTLGQLGLDPSALHIVPVVREDSQSRAFLSGSNLRLTIARLHPALESSNLPGMPKKAKPSVSKSAQKPRQSKAAPLLLSSSHLARRAFAQRPQKGFSQFGLLVGTPRKRSFRLFAPARGRCTGDFLRSNRVVASGATFRVSADLLTSPRPSDQ